MHIHVGCPMTMGPKSNALQNMQRNGMQKILGAHLCEERGVLHKEKYCHLIATTIYTNKSWNRHIFYILNSNIFLLATP